MKIALFPNYEKAGTRDLLEKTKEILSSFSECLVFDGTADEDTLYRECDIIITIGGDGTLIRHAKGTAVYGKPCLGINTGRLGFLANIEEKNLHLLEKLKKSDYTTENRMMLRCSVTEDGVAKMTMTALNDIVLSSGSVAKLMDIRMNISGDIIDYRADGIILATPTGSTAYSLSAGGPIIDPSVRCISLTPICSHSLTARPILASPDSEIELTVPDTSKYNAQLIVDGVSFGEVNKQLKVSVRPTAFNAKFINLTSSTIYKTLSYKF